VQLLFRRCDKIVQIQDIAKGFHGTPEFKDLPERVSEIQKLLAYERQSRKNYMDEMDKSGDDCLIQIQSMRKDLNAIFDRLERNTISEMKSRKTSLGNKIQADVDQLDDVTEKVQKLFEAFKDGCDTNEALSYIGFTKCHGMIFNAQLFLQDITKTDDFKVSFEPFKRIKEYMSSLEMLGEVACEGGEKLLPGPDHVFEVETQVQHNVKVADDRERCRIAGICRLINGEFLLSDTNNSKLKLVNSSFKVISTLNVPDLPRELSSTGQREAAVAVDDHKDRHEILLVRVKAGKIEHMRTIKFQHRCIGVVHHNGHLYISDSTALHVYDMVGGQDRQVYSDRAWEYTVTSCAVSPDGSQIYIINLDHHQLIILNKNGKKLSTLTRPELKNPYCDHITPQGHLFVSCCTLGTVVQVVEEDGKKTVKTLARWINFLILPISLCFNSSNNTLVVGQFGNNNIVELKLK